MLSADRSTARTLPPATVTSVGVPPSAGGSGVSATVTGPSGAVSHRRVVSSSPARTSGTTPGAEGVNGGAAAAYAISASPGGGDSTRASTPAVTGASESSSTVTGSPAAKGARSTSATEPAGTSSSSRPSAATGPASPIRRMRTIASEPPGATTCSRRSPSPPGTPGTSWRPDGGAAAGTQSAPIGVSPSTCWSRTAADTRPCRTWTCTAKRLVPGASASSSLISCSPPATDTPRPSGASMRPSGP